MPGPFCVLTVLWSLALAAALLQPDWVYGVPHTLW